VIRAIIFDLDGTLVRTEDLKALSYARAAVSLRPGELEEADVVEAFKDVVGLPREEVSEWLLRRFSLEEPVRARVKGKGARSLWEEFAEVRLSIYEQMLDSPGLLMEYACPYNASLLDYARSEGFHTGLATMSHRPQATKVLSILQLQSKFSVIATRDNVQRGKPDPEIYLSVAQQLGVPARESLVIEDSVNGIRAAIAAEMPCIAVTSNFTRRSVHESGLVEKRWIVDNPVLLLTVARQMIADQRVADIMAQSLAPPQTDESR